MTFNSTASSGTAQITQWLAEIRTLQEQVVALRQERDQAYTSAANWRKLYESEAQQRRSLSEQSQLRIQALTQTLNAYQGTAADDSELQAVVARVNQMDSLEEARSQLIEALQLCDQLSHRLRVEQVSHAQTRQSLTTALGDAVDLLAKEQAADAVAAAADPADIDCAA